MATVTRASLAQAVAQRVGLTQAAARAQVAAVVATIAEALASGETVKLRGVGSLRVAWRGPRRVVHPRSGQVMQVGARPRVFFRPAQASSRPGAVAGDIGQPPAGAAQ